MEEGMELSFPMGTFSNGIGNIHQSILSAQSETIPEPPELFFRVCTRPLSELRRTTVTELRVSDSARGSYLMLRTLQPTVTGTVKSTFGQNVLVLVEDHNKNQIVCCLHGHVHLKPATELKDLLPVNTVFVLKEPFLVACSNHDFAIVVGSPSDFVLVGRSHVLSKDVEALGWRQTPNGRGIRLAAKWLQIGNELYGKQKFHEATDAYIFALRTGGGLSTNLFLKMNLISAFFAQGCFESALKHALVVLSYLPSSLRARFCAGRSLYELGQFKEAKEYFEPLRHVSSSNKNVLAELALCEERLREAEGNVDIYKLYRTCFTNFTALIDHNNFLRDIEFRPVPGNERGVFATRDIEPGTLVLVEKALVGIFEPSSSTEHGIVGFFQTAFRAILNNPKSVGLKLYSLPCEGIQTDKNTKLFCDEVRELEPIVDVLRLYDLLCKNILRAENIRGKKFPCTCQVYLLASRFRHSCLPNCTLWICNDIITVRTCSPVRKGEELSLRRYSKYLSVREKQSLFRRQCYTCSCDLCELDKREVPELHDLREEIMTIFKAQKAVEHSVPSDIENNLLEIVEALELTYGHRTSLRLHLFPVYCELAKVVHRCTEDWKVKVALYLEMGLQSVGLTTDLLLRCAERSNPAIPHCSLMPDILFQYAGLMVEREYWCERLDLVEKWIKVLLLLERIFGEGNLQMLKERFSGFSEVQTLLSLFLK